MIYRITTFFIFFLMFSFISECAAAANSAKSEINKNAAAVSEEIENIRKTVDGFYAKFLYFAKKEKYINTENEKELKQFPELDDSYINKLLAMHKRAWKVSPEVGLDCNPILWAQDYPKEIKTKSVNVKGDAAMVTVHQLWYPGNNEPVCVSMKKKGNSWKIIDSISPEYFDKKNCSSWKPGDVFPVIKLLEE